MRKKDEKDDSFIDEREGVVCCLNQLVGGKFHGG